VAAEADAGEEGRKREEMKRGSGERERGNPYL
jgi:hypothetical protein